MCEGVACGMGPLGLSTAAERVSLVVLEIRTLLLPWRHPFRTAITGSESWGVGCRSSSYPPWRWRLYWCKPQLFALMDGLGSVSSIKTRCLVRFGLTPMNCVFSRDGDSVRLRFNPSTGSFSGPENGVWTVSHDPGRGLFLQNQDGNAVGVMHR